MFAWRLGVESDLVLLHRHIISLMVYEESSLQPWALTFIHCPTDWNLKEAFLNTLLKLGDRFVRPWVIVGDFNAVLD